MTAQPALASAAPKMEPMAPAPMIRTRMARSVRDRQPQGLAHGEAIARLRTGMRDRTRGFEHTRLNGIDCDQSRHTSARRVAMRLRKRLADPLWTRPFQGRKSHADLHHARPLFL